MAKDLEFACPNCGKKNLVSLAQIKKNLKGDVPVTLNCGCTISPHKILHKWAASLKGVLGKTKPKVTE